MRSHFEETAWRLRRAGVFVGLALTQMLFVPAIWAQAPPMEQKPAEQKAPEPRPAEQSYQRFTRRFIW